MNFGLVYDVDMDEDGLMYVMMILILMGCLLVLIIVDEVKKVLVDILEVKEMEVYIVWNLFWIRDKMFRYVKIVFGI